MATGPTILQVVLPGLAAIHRALRDALPVAGVLTLLQPINAVLADDLGLRFTSGTLPGKLDALRLDMNGPIGLLFLGLAIFSATIAVLHVRARRLWNDQFEAQRALIAELQMTSERATLFLGTEPQVFISWDGHDGKPEYEGNPGIIADAMTNQRILTFDAWLPPHEVPLLESAVERLRARGEGFSYKFRTKSDVLIEAEGRPVSGRAVLRLRCVTGESLEAAKAQAQVASLTGLVDSLKSMLDAIPQLVWLRSPDASLAWVNRAYVNAVEAKDAPEVISGSLELLERPTRDAIQEFRARGEIFRGAAQAVVAGDRRALDIIDVVSSNGSSGGIATDVTELETVRLEIERQSKAHVRTLDQLPTAVALFDRRQRLAFFNKAFNDLWQLERSFLATQPTDMELLDRLRADGKLPEQSDFREWKQGLQQSFQSNETLEDVWHLPSGRSLRVVTSPSTSGGVTYLFDDVTEQMHLATRYNRLASMQGETLDSLAEGVAVFGSNGRLQLHNPSFAALWSIDPASLIDLPHIDDVARLCPPETTAIWRELRSAVCGMPDERVSHVFETRTTAGKVFALGLTPLPEGASLLTVEDVTSRANAERMLSERNQALEAAARFRSEFIHNVSFELRSPLTSVVGIAQMLATGTAGPLNERQRSYATDLMRATDSVLALINDILDLASIEQTSMELKLGPVDLRRCVEVATAGLRDRFGGTNVKLELRVPPNVGAILGDERRIRQILFNLMANAIAFSEPGGTVVLSATPIEGAVQIRILDRGSPTITGDIGIGGDGQGRYERGQSLRLAIVRSLVELHRGRLTIEARDGGLRQVTCILPIAIPPAQVQLAAS